MNKHFKLVAGVAVGALMATTAFAEGLTVVSWGGAYTVSQIEAYHKPYTKEFGTKINSVDYSGGLAEVKAQVEAGNVTWDLVDLELSDAIRGCDEGLFEEISTDMLPAGDDGTPATSDFIDGALTECAVGSIVWSTVYAYNKDKLSGSPTTMADFFDTTKFPGKRGMRKGAKANLEFALIADGVPTSEVYTVLSTPEGVDRAFAKLDTIKNNVVWWEAGAQPPQLLADGEVVMSTAYNGRLFNAIAKEGQPFEIVWDGQVFDLDLWAVPKGAANKEEAMKFIAYSTDTTRNWDQSNYISYGPVRKSSAAKVSAEMAVHLPTSPANFTNALQNDFEWWADNQDDMNERFSAWLNQ